MLTYGGVSLFVVVFAVYPLALAVFKEANITRRLIPGTIACGAFTFTMTALPGSPQIQNLIPTRYFGTDAMAAPIMGIIASAVLFFGGVAYLEMRRRNMQRMEFFSLNHIPTQEKLKMKSYQTLSLLFYRLSV
ncbi:H+/gluconate symporter and related permeases [Actinobacillus equuli]|nr:H+/gluconate symporter and related permeases [Actinobacillus equuli]